MITILLAGILFMLACFVRAAQLLIIKRRRGL